MILANYYDYADAGDYVLEKEFNFVGYAVAVCFFGRLGLECLIVLYDSASEKSEAKSLLLSFFFVCDF